MTQQMQVESPQRLRPEPNATLLERVSRRTGAVVLMVGIAAVQSSTLWHYRGDRLDESEVVHFAVSFLGGDLEPPWQGYGAVNMYLTSAMFWLASLPARMFGPVDSLDGYAQMVFEDGGYFIRFGRLIYAVFGVATVFFCAAILKRLSLSNWTVVGLAAVMATSGYITFFANYLRIDMLIGMCVAGALWSVASGRRYSLIEVAAFIGLASATKISAISLWLFVGLYALWLLHKREISLVQAVLAAGLCIGIFFITQPYSSLAEQYNLLFARSGDTTFSYTKPSFSALGPRAMQIVRVLIEWVGWPVVVLQILVIPALLRWTRLTVAALLLIILTTVPYLISSEITYYWFAPTFSLLYLTAGLGIAATIAKASDKAREWKDPSNRPAQVVSALVVVLLGAVVVVQAKDHLYPQYFSVQPQVNRVAAKPWLEEQVEVGRSVLLDAPRLNFLPNVYDTSDIVQSKAISRAFIFNRWQDPYLNEIFTDWVIDSYDKRVTTTENFSQLKAIRLDFVSTTARTEFGPVELCSVEGQACRRLRPAARALPGRAAWESDRLVVEGVDGAATRLLLEQLELEGDGQFVVRIRLPGDVDGAVTMFLDSGTGFAEETKKEFSPGDVIEYRVWLPEDEDRVETLTGPGLGPPVGGQPFDGLDGDLFVTSPSIYGLYVGRSFTEVPQSERPRLEALQQFYDQILDAPLVRRFDQGAGAIVEIYDVTGRN